MKNSLNPFKSTWFYIGIALGISEWAGMWTPDFAKKALLNLPGVFLVSAVIAFLVLHAISMWAKPKLQDYAQADKRNFGPFIANLMSQSGHTLTGIGIVALAHYLRTSEMGANIQLFLTCLCVAPSFYWHAWAILQLIQPKGNDEPA